MLDIKLIREDPEKIKENLIRRNDKHVLDRLDKIISLDNKYRRQLQKMESLRRQKNEVTEKIADLKKANKPANKEIKQTREASQTIAKLENSVEKLRKELKSNMMRMPNIMHESVPVGDDEDANKIVRKWGKPEKLGFKPKDHIELAESLDLIDLERAAKISGARWYFMKNEMVLLNLSLMRYAIDFMLERGFTPIIPPHLMKTEPYQGVTDLNDFGDMLYKVEGEDLHLIATSEHPLTAMYMNEVVVEKDLPLLYTGFSTNFRKEAGTHGKDTKGIFRVHQFNKVEQLAITRPEDSWVWHEKLLKNAEEFFHSLKIPYRIMVICTGDLGTVAAKKYDLDAWLPGQGKYREMVSCSNCTTYQSIRLRIRYREKEGSPVKGYVHTLNSTLTTDRTLIAILENYQQKDGSIKVPLALRPYMGGKKVIGFK